MPPDPPLRLPVPVAGHTPSPPRPLTLGLVPPRPTSCSPGTHWSEGPSAPWADRPSAPSWRGKRGQQVRGWLERRGRRAVHPRHVATDRPAALDGPGAAGRHPGRHQPPRLSRTMCSKVCKGIGRSSAFHVDPGAAVISGSCGSTGSRAPTCSPPVVGGSPLGVSSTGVGGWSERASRPRGRRRSADGRLTAPVAIGSIIRSYGQS